MSSGGAWGWGHTQGGPRAEPPPREARSCCATSAFLSRLRPGAAEAPALARLSSAPPEFASGVGALTVPCPRDALPRPARAPAYLPSERRAPEASPRSSQLGETPPLPAIVPLPAQSVPAHRYRKGSRLVGVRHQLRAPRCCVAFSQKSRVETGPGALLIRPWTCLCPTSTDCD